MTEDLSLLENSLISVMAEAGIALVRKRPTESFSIVATSDPVADSGISAITNSKPGLSAISRTIKVRGYGWPLSGERANGNALLKAMNDAASKMDIKATLDDIYTAIGRVEEKLGPGFGTGERMTDYARVPKHTSVNRYISIGPQVRG